MSVQIQEIRVKNLGPIDQFSMKLGIFNLIYGRNEKGKTFLVEFLIRSLFRNPRLWKLRSEQGTGKVHVGGLEETVIEFSPLKDRKLEDYWEGSATGLPPDFSKLLTVKGAEVDLARVDGGVGKAVVKHYLSSQDLIDQIESRISPTIQETEIKDGNLIGAKRGEIKRYDELKNGLENVDRLFGQIDQAYSGSVIKMLGDEKIELEEKLKQMNRAKRYLAYRTAEGIKHLEKEKACINPEKLKEVGEAVGFYQKKQREMDQKRREQKESEKEAQHFDWLKKAKEVYHEQLVQSSFKPRPLFLILGLVMAGLSLAGLYFKIILGSAIAIVCAVFFGFLYLKKIQTRAGQILKNEELRKLSEEFRNRFGQELTGIPLIEALCDELSTHHHRSEVLKEQLDREDRELGNLQQTVEDHLYHLVGEKVTKESWGKTIRKLEINMAELESKIRDREKILAGLKVAASDYVSEDPGMKYSEKDDLECKEALNQIELRIGEETGKLNNLKQRICDQTEDPISTDWETAIQHFRDKRKDLTMAYKQIAAEIIGKKAVFDVLQDLRKDEDTKIDDGLKSDCITLPLKQITRRYNGLRLEKDQLIVSDDYNDFPISELSTGAQEQVLLALRIGFASKLLGKESLFLILDDAFQYSDWERREWLMDVIVDLAKSGWQILYFTMDDHIKTLFESKGKPFGKGFRMCELKGSGK
ncbi:AAA family ATPase [bacterium]|nr:AAA family ATPase [bacterium]